MSEEQLTSSATMDSATGLPLMSFNEITEGKKKTMIVLGVSVVISAGIGLLIAFLIYAVNRDVYNAKFEQIAYAGYAYAYLSAYIFARMVHWLNMYPLFHKSAVMRGDSGNLRANMLIYRQIGEGAHPGAIVLAEDGELGAYNRANRSLTHFVENSTGVALAVVLCSYPFALPTFISLCVFALGRIVHQIGYTNGYGSHAIGFLLSFLSLETLNGLLLLTAIKAT